MSTLSELLKELNLLPLGNIYKKTISGKSYYYHQYFLNGKRYTKNVSEEDLPNLKREINRRKEIELEIKRLKSKQKTIPLSKNAEQLTGFLMSGNNVVASFEKGTLIDIDEKHAPIIVKRTHSLEEFLKLRVIDMSRTNARILKRLLDIHVDDNYKSALYSYALSISDNYWFKPKHSKLKYQDVEFCDDSYFDTSLKGESTSTVFKNQLTPEITTTGSFEKGWKYIDGEWWLYKSGNDKQLFSELFCYKFAKLIDLPTATYEYDDGYIRSKNFADKSNFEPLASLLGDDDSYQSVFEVLYKLNKNIAREYIKLIFFDTVINNVDRHNENAGLLRDRNSGKIISLAPNFDNNLALYAYNGNLIEDPKKDGMIKLFTSFINKNENAKELFKQIRLKEINVSDIDECIKDIPIIIEESSSLPEVIVNRYNYLKNAF